MNTDDLIELSPMAVAIWVGIAFFLIIIGLIKREKDYNSGSTFIIAGIVVALIGTAGYIIKGLIYIIPIIAIFVVIWLLVNWRKL